MGWIVWAACASTHDPAAASHAAGGGDAVDVTGTWTSAPCGERSWVRTIVLVSDGTYSGSDPISPCPPGATCIWSGVVHFHGTWTRSDGNTVTLSEAAERRPPPAQVSVRPTVLTVTESTLVDEAGCRYEKAPK